MGGIKKSSTGASGLAQAVGQRADESATLFVRTNDPTLDRRVLW